MQMGISLGILIFSNFDFKWALCTFVAYLYSWYPMTLESQLIPSVAENAPHV